MGTKLPSALLAVACVAALAACGSGTSSSGGVQVVATTTQVGDFVRNVGGDRVSLRQILQPNSDPHEYEPRPSDVEKVTGAAVVFESGGDLDSWLGGVIHDAGGSPRVVKLIDSVSAIRSKHGGHEVDPHWWQDPRNAVLAVAAIRDALIRADPPGRKTYRRNAAHYAARLGRLDRGIASCMARVPAGARKIVTTHDALEYFGARYRVRIVGALIPSLSTASRPSARDIERLVGQIRRERVGSIFPETALNPKLERAVSRDAGAKVGKSLWGDALGPKGSNGATYLEAMASNTQAMVEGMTGGAMDCRPGRRT
jgi:zinc/manganese transport system substrate-binding protein